MFYLNGPFGMLLNVDAISTGILSWLVTIRLCTRHLECIQARHLANIVKKYTVLTLLLSLHLRCILEHVNNTNKNHVVATVFKMCHASFFKQYRAFNSVANTFEVPKPPPALVKHICCSTY